MPEPVRYDSSLKVFPAAIALLEFTRAPPHAFTVEPETFEDGGHTATVDVLTVDWDVYADGRLAATTQRVAAIARSLLDGTPVDLSQMVHFGEETGGSVVDALALIWGER